ncbi:hypothetical protein [Synechocystis salina]
MIRLPVVLPQSFLPPRLLSRHWGWLAIAVAALGGISTLPVSNNSSVVAQTAPSSPMTVRSDIQEANSQTGVVTARGNVQVTILLAICKQRRPRLSIFPRRGG